MHHSNYFLLFLCFYMVFPSALKIQLYKKTSILHTLSLQPLKLNFYGDYILNEGGFTPWSAQWIVFFRQGETDPLCLLVIYHNTVPSPSKYTCHHFILGKTTHVRERDLSTGQVCNESTMPGGHSVTAVNKPDTAMSEKVISVGHVGQDGQEGPF